MNKQTTACTLPLRIECIILDPQGEHHHTIKLNYADLNERWCFNQRLEDCLRQGYAVGMKKIDPRAERLAAKYPVHG